MNEEAGNASENSSYDPPSQNAFKRASLQQASHTKNVIPGQSNNIHITYADITSARAQTRRSNRTHNDAINVWSKPTDGKGELEAHSHPVLC